MLRILVVYGSTHGHTCKVADAIAETLGAAGILADVREAGRAAPPAEGYAAVVVAASVHGGKYQKPVMRWVRAHAFALNRMPTAFVSVCLGVLQHDDAVRTELEAIVGRYLEAAGWRGPVVKQVAGALPYTKYNWFLRRMMKRIAAQAGGDTDTSRDYEYTDWNDLAAFTKQFGRSVAEHVSPAAAVVHAVAS
jgi:menaquinone-dependent protoporphyrinogen oxidase